MDGGTPNGAQQWTLRGPARVPLTEPVARLRVSLIASQLNVVGTDGPPRVEITRVGRRPLLMEHAGGVLTLRHEFSPHWSGLVSWRGFLWWLGGLGRRYQTDVSVAVPHETLAELRVIAGSMVASGLRADAALDMTSGRITLLGLDGTVSAKVVSGSIEALGVRGDLTMEAVSGEITLADSAARRVHATAVSGALTCDLDNAPGGDIRLETTSGEITVRVREDSDLDVRLEATSGRVSSGFRELRPTEHRSMNTARGTLGAGTGTLYASAVSGNISLLARPVESA